MHHAVWSKVQHIFNSGAIIFLPVLPTLCPPSMITLFSSHPTPTLLSLLRSPSLLPTDLCTFTKYCSKPANSSHLLSHERKKQMNHSRQREWRAGRYDAGAIDQALVIHFLLLGGRGLRDIREKSCVCLCVCVDLCMHAMCE